MDSLTPICLFLSKFVLFLGLIHYDTARFEDDANRTFFLLGTKLLYEPNFTSLTHSVTQGCIFFILAYNSIFSFAQKFY